jgi:hypothetical protein
MLSLPPTAFCLYRRLRLMPMVVTGRVGVRMLVGGVGDAEFLIHPNWNRTAWDRSSSSTATRRSAVLIRSPSSSATLLFSREELY